MSLTVTGWQVHTSASSKSEMVPSIQAKTLDKIPPGYVAVKLLASGLNHRDNWITKKMYPGIREGCILGADGCGVAMSGQFKDKLVVIDPSLGWGPHDAAPTGVLEILGTPRDGCFADIVVVPEVNLYPKPAHLSALQAAAVPLAGVTAYRALVFKGKPVPGDRVLVTGIGGGVAVFAAQFAVALGLDVYVTSSSQAKIDAAQRLLKVKGGVLYTDANWPKTLLKMAGGKFNVCIDGAGGDGLADCLRCMAGGGRVVSYGSTAGPVNLNLAPVFLNNVEILGTAMGSPRDFVNMMRLVSDKQIVPVVDQVFALKDFVRALDKMRAGGQMGKLVLDHVGGSSSKL